MLPHSSTAPSSKSQETSIGTGRAQIGHPGSGPGADILVLQALAEHSQMSEIARARTTSSRLPLNDRVRE
jgi:hypothetical protein